MSDRHDYPGRKGAEGVTQQIISLMPRHKIYLEPFLGKSPIFRTKHPADIADFGGDLDPTVVAYWHRTAPSLYVAMVDAMQLLSSSPAMQDPATLVYLDPPYLRSTRTKRLYTYEFDSVEQHARLIQLITRVPAKVMLSGYASSLYSTLLEGWRCHAFNATTRGGARIEHVWMNFPADVERHDTRFLGEGFRERERIKRKRQRWVSRLAAMPPAERQAIAEALHLAQVSHTPAASTLVTIPPGLTPRPSPPLTVRSAPPIPASIQPN